MRKTILKTVLLASVIVGNISCTDAYRAKLFGMNDMDNIHKHLKKLQNFLNEHNIDKSIHFIESAGYY